MIERLYIFPKDINPKVDVIAWLGFEIAYFEAAVQHVSNYAKGSSTGEFIIRIARLTFYNIVFLHKVRG